MWKLTDKVLHGDFVRAGDINVEGGGRANDQIFIPLICKEVNRGQRLACAPYAINADQRFSNDHCGSELGIDAGFSLFLGACEIEPPAIYDSVT